MSDRVLDIDECGDLIKAYLEDNTEKSDIICRETLTDDGKLLMLIEIPLKGKVPDTITLSPPEAIRRILKVD